MYEYDEHYFITNAFTFINMSSRLFNNSEL